MHAADSSAESPTEIGLARLAVVLGTLIAVLDLGMINIALPTLGDAFGVAESRAVWVSTVYQLVSAAALLSVSAVSRGWGPRGVYSLGLIFYTLGAVGAALAPGFGVLIAARLLQGLGAAALLALGPALLKSIYPAHRLGRALALNALVVAFGLGAGPMLGGAVLSVLGWRGIFALTLPMGLAALVMTRRALPRDERHPLRFDLPGALCSSVMMGALMLAFERFSHSTSLLSGTGLLVLSGVAATGFVARQRRAPQPLLPLALFESPRFSYAILVTLFAFTAQGLAFVALSFLYQSTLGFSALGAALLFSPWPLTLLVSGPLSGRLSDRFNPALLSTGGLAVFCLGLVALAWAAWRVDLAGLVASSILCGLGYGFFQAPNNHEVMANAPAAHSAGASGVLASVRTLAQSLGSASFGLIAAMSGGQVAVTLWTGVGLAVLALAISTRRIGAQGVRASVEP